MKSPNLDYKLLEQFSYQEVIKMTQDAEQEKKLTYRKALSQGKYGKLIDYLQQKYGKTYYADKIDKIIRTFFEDKINILLNEPQKYDEQIMKIDFTDLYTRLAESGEQK